MAKHNGNNNIITIKKIKKLDKLHKKTRNILDINAFYHDTLNMKEQSGGGEEDVNKSNANNGLITKIWGPAMWDSVHSITFGYPLEPSKEDKERYKIFFTYLGFVLPCIFCKQSYQQFISDNMDNMPDTHQELYQELIKTGDTVLNDKVFESRDSLCRWGWRLHNTVNKKLDVDYGVTYDEFVDKYESYRAKCTHTGNVCIMPLDMKAESYEKKTLQRAPVIDVKYAEALENHAIMLGLKDYPKEFKYYSSIERNSKEWKQRDKECRNQIDIMRINGTSSIGDDGLPTKDEMYLIARLSTNLERKQIKEMVKKIQNNQN